MKAPTDTLRALAGRYSGTYTLWFEPGEPPRESATTSTIRSLCGNFFAVDLAWSFEGKPQEGQLLYSYDAKTRRLRAIFIDSWHMSSQFMDCQGEPTPSGAVIVVGTYSGGGEQWGWRTEIAPTEEGFAMRVVNVSPAGEETQAVEAQYTRA